MAEQTDSQNLRLLIVRPGALQLNRVIMVYWGYLASKIESVIKTGHGSILVSIIRINSTDVIYYSTIDDNANYITSITPFGATNGASEIVSLARAKLRRGTSN